MKLLKLSSHQAWFVFGGLLLGMVLIVLVASFEKRVTRSIQTDQHARDCMVEARTAAVKSPFKFTDKEIVELCAPEVTAAKEASVSK
jgi:hypothetical protein